QCDASARDLLSQHDGAARIEADQVKGVLAHIYSDGGHCAKSGRAGHGGAPFLTSPRRTLKTVGGGSAAGPSHSRKWRNAAMMSAPGEIRRECAKLRAVPVLPPDADFTLETKIQPIGPNPDEGAVPTNSFRRMELVRGPPMTLPVALTSQDFFRDPAA